MENAVEALKTAAAVLVFIIAITTSFVMFSKAKIATDAVITSQDKQEYLEVASLDNGRYTSSDSISKGVVPTMTTNGDRIVNSDDVIATIYRYYNEKYGVTIIENNTVIARFDSSTESLVQSLPAEIKQEDGTIVRGDDILAQHAEDIKKNIAVDRYSLRIENINIDLKNLYRIENIQKRFGAPWNGNPSEIIKRINADLQGKTYISTDAQKYKGKNIIEKLKNKKIIEVINEIDNSKYLVDKETGEEKTTDLLQEYNLPTIEVIYILQ